MKVPKRVAQNMGRVTYTRIHLNDKRDSNEKIHARVTNRMKMKEINRNLDI